MTIVANPRAYKIPDWFLNRQKDVKDGRYSQVRGTARALSCCAVLHGQQGVPRSRSGRACCPAIVASCTRRVEQQGAWQASEALGGLAVLLAIAAGQEQGCEAVLQNAASQREQPRHSCDHAPHLCPMRRRLPAA